MLGAEMTRTIDFGSYIKSLCLQLAEIQGAPEGTVTLTCDSQPFIIDLDAATALGIVVTEVVTNSYDHAFPGGKGSITVSVGSVVGDGSTMTMTMTLRDDGEGFKPQAESKRHGLGLVRRLVEQVGGISRLDSEKGTVWTIEIPVPPLAVPDAAVSKVGAGREPA